MSTALPPDAAAATERLAAAEVPASIVGVARVLREAGHAAALVGGAVRDALLGLSASDWDLASSATPSEVVELFPKTIPTGLEHGTVTVLVRGTKGGKRIPVEVTTFRGEGAYVDGRRPTEVTFLRDLEDDLARRDFTVNAFAWDPIDGVFTDPFGGLEDLRAGWVRAVGDPAARFTEDGLRTMRAVRFCATRALKLEPKTAAAIPKALSVLDMVSRERVLIELTKLLGAAEPSRGLEPMRQTGMWTHVFPALGEADLEAAIEAVDGLPPDVGLRLARLLWPLARSGEGGRSAAVAAVVALKPSKELRRRLEALWSPALLALEAAADPVAIRQAAASVGRGHVSDALSILEVDPARREAVEAALEGAALSIGELAIAGRDLVAAEVCKPGRGLGDLLRALLAEVVVDPARNDADALLDAARRIVAAG